MLGRCSSLPILGYVGKSQLFIFSIENKKGYFWSLTNKETFFDFGCPAYARQLIFGFTGYDTALITR